MNLMLPWEGMVPPKVYGTLYEIRLNTCYYFRHISTILSRCQVGLMDSLILEISTELINAFFFLKESEQ